MDGGDRKGREMEDGGWRMEGEENERDGGGKGKGKEREREEGGVEAGRWRRVDGGTETEESGNR